MVRYFHRKWNTLPIIGSHYCPLTQAGCDTWVPNVTSFYRAQSGDTGNLTFHIGVIDFEEYEASTVFTSVQPPITVFVAINGNLSKNPNDSAIISGGILLDAATFLPVGRSGVYGTASFCSGCAPKITIQFATKVSNFSVFLMNGEPMVVSYIVEDDQGGMQTRHFWQI
jgi:hypothetical protein